jgi:two-component system response regulator QseB
LKVLLLEDDLQLGKALTKALAQEGFAPQWLRRVQEARSILEYEIFAAALVDIGLPDGSGLDLLQWLRTRGNALPVLLLTARDAVEDRVRGLDAGADDYLPKPFAIPELVSRIRALVRRSAGFATQTWQIGNLTIDPVRHEVRHGDQLIELSPREFQVLVELMRHQGQIVPKRALAHAVFSLTDNGGTNALEVHVHNLRRKLPESLIRTVRGVGYLIE